MGCFHWIPMGAHPDPQPPPYFSPITAFPFSLPSLHWLLSIACRAGPADAQWSCPREHVWLALASLLDGHKQVSDQGPDMWFTKSESVITQSRISRAGVRYNQLWLLSWLWGHRHSCLWLWLHISPASSSVQQTLHVVSWDPHTSLSGSIKLLRNRRVASLQEQPSYRKPL